FTTPVTLSVGAPPDLQVSLSPAVVTPPGTALLTITDTHPGPDLLPGILYTLPISATSGDVTRTASISLLVGGARVYVPVIVKGSG
ncbi:MAG: hypothetical protein D6784_03125, partial [Chloroflexi bacterium]